MKFEHLIYSQTNFRSIFDTLDVSWPNQHYYRMDVPMKNQTFSDSMNEAITIIDLRSQNELDTDSYEVLEKNVNYLHMPMYGNNESLGNAPEKLMRFKSMGDMYVFIAENYSDNIIEVIRYILLNKKETIVFHCSAGKDRTGIIAMLLLEILEAPREAIIESYTLSEVNREKIHEQIKSYFATQGKILPDYIFQSKPSDIQQLYDYIEDKHGTVKDYLRNYGLQDDWMESFNEYVKGDIHGTYLN